MLYLWDMKGMDLNNLDGLDWCKRDGTKVLKGKKPVVKGKKEVGLTKY
jgi:hypothetical protein